MKICLPDRSIMGSSQHATCNTESVLRQRLLQSDQVDVVLGDMIRVPFGLRGMVRFAGEDLFHVGFGYDLRAYVYPSLGQRLLVAEVIHQRKDWQIALKVGML